MLATTSESAAILIFVLCMGAIAFRVVMYTRWEAAKQSRSVRPVHPRRLGADPGPGPMISEQPTSAGQPGGADSLSFADLRADPSGSESSGPVPPPPPDIPYDESWSSDPEPVIRTRPCGIPIYWKLAIASIAFSAVDVRVPHVRDADANGRSHRPVLLPVHVHPDECDGHDAPGVGNPVGRQSVAAGRVPESPLSA